MFSRETIRDPTVRAVNKTGGDKVERNARIGAFMAEEDFLTRRLIDPLGKSSRLDTHTGLAHSALKAFDAQWTNASRDYKRRRVSPSQPKNPTFLTHVAFLQVGRARNTPKSRDPTAPDPVSPEQWAGFGGAPFLAPASALSRPPSTTDTVAPQLLESPENTGRKVEIEDDDNDNDDALFRSIRKVLVADPKYAQGVIAAIRELPVGKQQFLRQSCDCTRGRGSSNDGNHVGVTDRSFDEDCAANETVDEGGGSSTGAANPKQTAVAGSSTAPARLSSSKPGRNRVKSGNEGEGDEDQGGRQNKRASSGGCADKTWLCPYSIMYPHLVSGACRPRTSFRSLSDLR
ncbi:hypothetical protein Ct61P_09894 [Colletotrichum tofieldiae]|nr:hypothetical protein Ct61P_09894 [Colletotrichum tofieldiae]